MSRSMPRAPLTSSTVGPLCWKSDHAWTCSPASEPLRRKGSNAAWSAARIATWLSSVYSRDARVWCPGIPPAPYSEPTRLRRISYAVFCLKKKKKHNSKL
eukprot:NODE_27755_length_502_cov_1.288000.p1 GENE.NODE_27755_length_502_cov_1.288000~~NODE_27755_length_502_cov_1.288000.p1  ORF type:complete len:100 (-),score=16.49 NODE_27755_length_502_cov_1.288000:117-416(-)